jgi:phage-related minor tail protein
LLVTAIAHGVSPGTTNQSFRQMFSVRKTFGTTTIAAAGALEQIGDAGGSTWTLVASVGAAPDRFALTFANGVSSTYVRVRAKIEIVEVFVPLM